MRIDVHAHYFPQEFVDCVARVVDPAIRPTTARAPGQALDLDERLALMDSAGIDMQVLSASAAQPYARNRGDAVEAARLGNDLYADVCKRYPRRFAAFGAVPLPHVDAAVAEVERCLDTLGFKGITTGCSVAGRQLDDAAFEPFWAELDRRATVLFLHPLGKGFGAELQGYGLDWLIGALLEDTIAALRLVLSGITTRYPNITVIVPHLGGTIPFAMGRVGGANAAARARTGQPPVYFEGTLYENLRRVYYDTLNHQPASLRCACEVLGADHLVLGTDFPYSVDDRFRHCVQYVEEAGLSPEETEAILGGTAQRLLGL